MEKIRAWAQADGNGRPCLGFVSQEIGSRLAGDIEVVVLTAADDEAREKELIALRAKCERYREALLTLYDQADWASYYCDEALNQALNVAAEAEGEEK